MEPQEEQKMTTGNLQHDFEQILEQQQVIRELNADLKEAKEAHALFEEIEEKRKELKKLRDEMQEDEEIMRLKDDVSRERERLSLLKEVFVARMLDKGDEEITSKGKRAILTKNVKIEKDKRI